MGFLDTLNRVSSFLTAPLSGKKRQRDELDRVAHRSKPSAGSAEHKGLEAQEAFSEGHNNATIVIGHIDHVAVRPLPPLPPPEPAFSFELANRVRELQPKSVAATDKMTAYGGDSHSTRQQTSGLVGDHPASGPASHGPGRHGYPSFQTAAGHPPRLPSGRAPPTGKAQGATGLSQRAPLPGSFQSGFAGPRPSVPQPDSQKHVVLGMPASAASTPAPQQARPKQLHFTPGSALGRFGDLHLNSVPRGGPTSTNFPQMLSTGSAAAVAVPALSSAWGLPTPSIPRAGHGTHFLDNYRFSMGPGPVDLSVENFRQMHAAMRDQAWRSAQVPLPTPRREDGGLITDDVDEADERAAEAGRAALSMIQRLQMRTDAACRTAAGDARVAAASATKFVTQSALAATSAAAAAQALSSVELKRTAHDAMVQQVRRTGQEAAKQKVDAIKAEDEARLRKLQLERQPSPQQAAASAVSRPSAGLKAAAAARGAAAKAAAPRKPAEEEEVMDLVSSGEEEEEEEEEVEEPEAAEEDAVAPNNPYRDGGPRGGIGADSPALRKATAAERATWRRAMDKEAPPGEVLLAFAPNPATDIKLPRAKLQCMASKTWLNDEVINLYMLLLQERDARWRGGGGGRRPRCHFFNSFFYNKLFHDDMKYNYANVRRWTTAVRLRNNLQASPGVLELDRIIFPIHLGVHWTCAVLDLRAKAVRYYDSLKGEEPALAEHLLRWLSDESADKLKTRWDTSGWAIEFPKAIPTQRNGCDCGVFAMMFADRLGAGIDFDFDQADMEALRVSCLHRIVRMRVD